MDTPKITNTSPELEIYFKKIIDSDNPHFIKDMNEYKVRQLLKSRVKRIFIS